MPSGGVLQVTLPAPVVANEESINRMPVKAAPPCAAGLYWEIGTGRLKFVEVPMPPYAIVGRSMKAAFAAPMHVVPATTALAARRPKWASSLSDSGFSINNDGCSAAPARSSDRRRRPDHVLTGFISARRWRHGRPISRISTENRLFASLGRAQDKDPLHVPRHGHKTPFAAHLIQPTQ